VFVGERQWDQFHTPKNLAAALSVEAAELLECFQWLTPEESESIAGSRLDAVRDEIGDVLIYLIRLSDRLDIDPLEAARQKLAKNRVKYPIEKVKGSAKKHSEI
jgi:NTP pyrophosphatase (non-canonical NTP hydrolase)